MPVAPRTCPRSPPSWSLSAPAAALALAAVACAAPSSSVTAPTPSTDVTDVTGVAAVAVEPTLVGEVVPLTVELVRARPENPPGHEERVVNVLLRRLGDAGATVSARLPSQGDVCGACAPGTVDVVSAPFGDGRANLKATLRGRDPAKGALLLVGHSDVVPADASEWSAPPYEGTLRGERLIGRGTSDMLGMVALETLALVALQQEAAAHGPFERDIVLLVTGDEEVDGTGIVEALRAWPELKRAAFALNEGAFMLESYLRPGEDLAAIAVAEKGVLQVQLDAEGPSGHGSTPVDDAAADRIVRATARMLAREPAFRMTSSTARQLKDIGSARGGVEGIVLGNAALAEWLAKPTLLATPTTRALYFDTCALTILEAGIKRNVIPGRARATFDCRLLPGTEPSAFRDDLLRIVDDPRVKLSVLHAGAANGSDPDGAVVDVIRARVKRELPGAVVAATLTKGVTDCRFLRAAGVACYGFVPVRLTRDELDAIHGKDESVRVGELEKGLPRLVDIAASLARLP